MAKIAYTLHSLVGLTKDKKPVAPGTVLSMSDEQFDELEKLSAVRKASDNETELFEAQSARKTKAKAPKETAAEKKKRLADQAAAEAEAEKAENAGASNDDALLG